MTYPCEILDACSHSKNNNRIFCYLMRCDIFRPSSIYIRCGRKRNTILYRFPGLFLYSVFHLRFIDFETSNFINNLCTKIIVLNFVRTAFVICILYRSILSWFRVLFMRSQLFGAMMVFACFCYFSFCLLVFLFL